MKISQAYPSDYLKATDLDDQQVTLRMLRVEIGKIGNDEKPILYFEGEKKGLVLNKTNAKIIKETYGEETDDWIGEDLTIYPTMVDFRGDMVEAIRVRIMKGKKGAAPRSEFKSGLAKPPYEPDYDEEGYPIK